MLHGSFCILPASTHVTGVSGGSRLHVPCRFSFAFCLHELMCKGYDMHEHLFRKACCMHHHELMCKGYDARALVHESLLHASSYHMAVCFDGFFLPASALAYVQAASCAPMAFLHAGLSTIITVTVACLPASASVPGICCSFFAGTVVLCWPECRCSVRCRGVVVSRSPWPIAVCSVSAFGPEGCCLLGRLG